MYAIRFSSMNYDFPPTTLDHIWVNSSFKSKSGIIYAMMQPTICRAFIIESY